MTDGLTEDCGGTQSLVPFSMSHGADECKIKHSMMLNCVVLVKFALEPPTSCF